jgi:hypothetical protein
MDFSFFVISLKRTPGRLQGFRVNNAETGIDFEHFDAIDGATLDSFRLMRPVTHRAHWGIPPRTASCGSGAANSKTRL